MKRVWNALMAGMRPPEPVTWPKATPALTAEQEAIRERFLADWLAALPTTYGRLEHFNQSYVLRRLPPRPWRVLEIGAGIGAHLEHEPGGWEEYTVCELRAEFAAKLKRRYPETRVIVGDIQRGIDVPDGYFNRIMAIHVLEHLPDLPAALREARRILSPDGILSVVIPCEGGALYELAREISTRRQFEKRFQTSYDWFVKTEHVSKAPEIIQQLHEKFEVIDTSYWPLRVKCIPLNLVMGLSCRPREDY